jgi:NAD+ synthase (glutamine-hydrolysing)
MQTFGFIRVAAVSPKIHLANPAENAREIKAQAQAAEAEGAAVILFPELCVTGYSCADLFFSEQLYAENLNALSFLIDSSKGMKSVWIVGFPLRLDGSLYNCAGVIQNGRLKGVIPKMFLPNAGEFNESRWFSPGTGIAVQKDKVNILGAEVPFGNLLFKDEEGDFSFGVEICHDVWMPVTPGTRLVLAEANTIFNPSGSTQFAGKKEQRHNLVKTISEKDQCGYVYASAGPSESTSDSVFSGDDFVVELGEILAESEMLLRGGTAILADIDYHRIAVERMHEQNFGISANLFIDRNTYHTVDMEPLSYVTKNDRIIRHYSRHPFVPESPEAADAYCREIFQLQATALAERLERSHSQKAVIGVSGGSDSTLALLVAARAMELLDRTSDHVLAVTMPGLGTTDHTRDNAFRLMDCLGCEVREIPITEAVLQHFRDIGHNPSNHDVTFENAQARERTQILMDVANQVNGLVVGTGDLSEMALGWCTFNGDHMSMYAINAGIPKSLVKQTLATMVKDIQDGKLGFRNLNDPKSLARTLEAVLKTPISPELLPPDPEGNILQKTEDKVGPYELHDFFLYHCIKRGMRPDRVLHIAQAVFKDDYDPETIAKWLRVFLSRFFSQQFKRNCVPDGPKLISFGMSPRGDWRMPSDASAASWLSGI